MSRRQRRARRVNGKPGSEWSGEYDARLITGRGGFSLTSSGSLRHDVGKRLWARPKQRHSVHLVQTKGGGRHHTLGSGTDYAAPRSIFGANKCAGGPKLPARARAQTRAQRRSATESRLATPRLAAPPRLAAATIREPEITMSPSLRRCSMP